MAWIPMRTDLARDPTVLRLMDAFDLDAYSIVGRLHALWSWVDEQTLDGNADVTPARCDVMVSVPGFTEVLRQEEWVAIHNDRVEFLNWDRWNLQTTKARLLASRRVVTHRKRKRVTTPLTTVTVTEQNREETKGATPPEKKDADTRGRAFVEEVLEILPSAFRPSGIVDGRVLGVAKQIDRDVISPDWALAELRRQVQAMGDETTSSGQAVLTVWSKQVQAAAKRRDKGTQQ